MSSEVSLSQAHRYATNAEEYAKEGLLALAADEHLKSAETFQQCSEQASDEGTKKTLRMLYNEHVKLGKDLQRRIIKLQEEGKDPTQPHPPQSVLPQIKPGNFRPRSPYDNARRPPYLPTSPPSGYSSPQIDESYMVLGNQSELHDTFDRFWKSLEGMLDKLSQPVAFATAPLAQHNQSQENQSAGTTKSLQNRHKRTYTHNKAIADSFCEIENVSDEDDDESFFMVSPTNESVPFKRENEVLKARLTELESRLQTSEKMRIEQEKQLRERVEAARREAHRVKASGILPPRPPPPLALDLGPLNMALSSLPAISQNKESQLSRRIKDLEDELRALRMENEKQKTTITKFKERWDKLKDSARKKRQARLNSTNEVSLVDQRIDEDPEAETIIDS